MKPPIESADEIRDGTPGLFYWTGIFFGLLALFALVWVIATIFGRWLACNLDGICR